MTKKELKKLIKIKSYAVRLDESYCIPHCLYLEIVRTNHTSSVERVQLLMDLSQRFLRNKGYYEKGYPFVVADIRTCHKLCQGLPQ